MIKVKLLSLLLTSFAGVLHAQPVDLLQQLYGKKSPAPSTESEESADAGDPLPTTPITLSFRERFDASRERLYMSDLLSCKGSQKICDELKAVDVGTSPKPNRFERFNRKQVAAIVEREFPSQELLWEGSDFCMVSAVSTPIDEAKVKEVIAEEFEDSPAGTRVTVQSVRTPSMTMLRHNNYAYKIKDAAAEISKVFQNPRARFAQVKMLAQDLDPSSHSSIEFLVQVSLRTELEALVLKNSKERGERITEADIEPQWINYQEQVFLDGAQVVGKLLKTRVSAGNPIRNWDVKREPEVLRGDRVEAIVSGNGLKINGVAEALEQGFIGQKIKIRLESTKKTVMGTVIAKSQVEVPRL